MAKSRIPYLGVGGSSEPWATDKDKKFDLSIPGMPKKLSGGKTHKKMAAAGTTKASNPYLPQADKKPYDREGWSKKYEDMYQKLNQKFNKKMGLE